MSPSSPSPSPSLQSKENALSLINNMDEFSETELEAIRSHPLETELGPLRATLESTRLNSANANVTDVNDGLTSEASDRGEKDCPKV